MRRLYLAYGSNLHPVRLTERVPSARLVGTARLAGCRVAFVKRGRDGSGKASLVFTDQAEQTAYGAVYALEARHKPVLDAIEGLGQGYDERALEVSVNGHLASVFTYVAGAGYTAAGLVPYDWYRALVTAGAHHHGFPADYVGALAAVRTQPDPDRQRRARHTALLERLGRASPESNQAPFGA